MKLNPPEGDERPDDPPCEAPEDPFMWSPVDTPSILRSPLTKPILPAARKKGDD